MKIADKRAIKDGGDGDTTKPTNEVDDTLKKLLIMLIKPLVENGAGRINPFFPFPPSAHPSPPHANLLGGLSALSALSGGSNSPEAVKKAAKIVHKLKEQLKAASVENEIDDAPKGDDIPVKITLNNKPMKLQVDDDGDENASVAEKSEKLVDLAKLYPLLLQEQEEEKPKRKKKKPKVKAIDPLEVYLKRVLTQQIGGCGVNNPFFYNYNPNLNALLAPKIPLLTPRIPQPQYLATEFVVHVPVIIKNKPPPPPPPQQYNYPLLNSLLTNYAF